ncbi:MAG TPA: AI-2E family transporter [Steroidobacteraceae bacterium]|nr:AI-2E family transporter [Steroidobacteraceae bacterium]
MAVPRPDMRAVPEPPAPDAPPPRSPWTARAVGLLAVLASVAALKFAQSAVVPVLFAVFLALILSPVVELLARHRVPRILAATLVMTTLLAVVGAALSATWEPAREWLDTAPATFDELERKLRPLVRFIAKVESVSTQAGRMATPDPARHEEPTPVSVEPKGFIESTQEWTIAIVSMLFLALFLLATDIASLGRDGPPGAPWSRAGSVFLRVRSELGRYFGAVTLSNLVLGLGTTATMYWLEMPNPLLWGLIAFVLNFIPYAGSATTLMLLTVVALVSFDGVAKAVSVAGVYLLLTTLEGQVLQPVLVGRRLDITPPVVLLGLWFGGWLWGVAGVALAMPLLVSVKAAAQEIARSRSAEQIEPDAETVRTRASEWLRANANRYRRLARTRPRS